VGVAVDQARRDPAPFAVDAGGRLQVGIAAGGTDVDDAALGAGQYAIADDAQALAIEGDQVDADQRVSTCMASTTRLCFMSIQYRRPFRVVQPCPIRVPTHCFHAAHALLAEGWARDVRLQVQDGRIAAISMGQGGGR
jgi:hypothetical protein